MSEEVWFYATCADAESWDGPCYSREDAIAEGAAELGIEPGEHFFINTGMPHSATEFMPSARDILEQAANSAADECGEAAEDWPDASPEEESELNALLSEWAEKHCPVRFWSVDGTAERIDVPGAP